MRGAKSVVFGFQTFGKAGNPAELPQRGHCLAATRENFVRIGLVPDVPDNAIMGCVENVMQCYREFDRTKVGREVTTRSGHGLQNALAQFVGDLFEVTPVERLEIGGRVDPVKKLSRHKKLHSIQSTKSCQKPSVIAQDDEIRDPSQPAPGFPKGFERCQCLLVEFACKSTRCVQPEQRHIRGLIVGGVLACGLA